jgi:hypothetical protein
MTNYSRPMSPIAAAIFLLAMSWAATPAAAVEDSAPMSAAAQSAPAKSPDVKSPDVRTSRSLARRHAWRRTHFATYRYRHRFNPIGAAPACPGEWCGRQFVLMVGIGF